MEEINVNFRIFLRWLKNHGCYNEYTRACVDRLKILYNQNECPKSSNSIMDYVMNVFVKHPEEAINYTTWWSKTKEGETYWSEKDKEWRLYWIYKKYGEIK